MSHNDRSNEPVSDKNCGTCRWAQWPTNERWAHGWCHAPVAPLPACINDSRSTVYRAVDGYKVTGTNCPCWQAKETR